MGQVKVRDLNLAFLLAVACLLTIYGALGSVYCWFTGAKLTVVLALVSMYGRLLTADGNLLARYLSHGCAGGALLVGSHLLAPYFWPVRGEQLELLMAFVVTAALAWGYMLWHLHQLQWSGTAYKYFSALPVVVFVGGLLSVQFFAGTLYAAIMLDLYYAILAVLLLVRGIKYYNRIYFNAGILIFVTIGTALCLTFVFNLPSMAYAYGAVIVTAALNAWFTWRSGKDGK